MISHRREAALPSFLVLEITPMTRSRYSSCLRPRRAAPGELPSRSSVNRCSASQTGQRLEGSRGVFRGWKGPPEAAGGESNRRLLVRRALGHSTSPTKTAFSYDVLRRWRQARGSRHGARARRLATCGISGSSGSGRWRWAVVRRSHAGDRADIPRHPAARIRRFPRAGFRRGRRQPMEANLAKVPSTSLAGPAKKNRLQQCPRLSGEEAGLPGTSHQVEFKQRRGSGNAARPKFPQGMVSMWASYMRSEIPSLRLAVYDVLWQQGFVLRWTFFYWSPSTRKACRSASPCDRFLSADPLNGRVRTDTPR